MPIQPYLFFNGRCDEAIELYKRVLGAEVELLMRNRESPVPHQPGMLPPGSEDKVMHATLRIGDAVVMASDGMCSGSASFEGFSLSLTLPRDRAERVFAGLSDGGSVQMPLGKTFWSPLFGMVKDRLGVQWMISVPQ